MRRTLGMGCSVGKMGSLLENCQVGKVRLCYFRFLGVKTPQQELGRFIQLARCAAGLSRQELGDRIGVTREAVRLWEHGRRAVDVCHVQAIARATEQDVRLFLGEESNGS